MNLNTRKFSSSVEINGDLETRIFHYTIPRDTIIYTLEGDPEAWARAVPIRRNRMGMWDSQKKLKLHLGLLMGSMHGDRPFYEGPLLLDVKFCMPMNQKMLKHPERYEDSWFGLRPDMDNCIKLIMDTGNDVLYEDDKLFCASVIQQVYSANPRTEFRIIELS